MASSRQTGTRRRRGADGPTDANGLGDRGSPPPGAPTSIVHVLWGLVAGGMEIYVLRLAARLESLGYRSFLCPLDKGGALEPEIQRLGIGYQVMHRRAGIDVLLMGRLYGLFRRLNADIVHTHHVNGLVHAAVAARVAGARLVHTEHTTGDLVPRDVRLASRGLLKLCDAVVGVGPNVTALLSGVGVPAGKLLTILAGVDAAAYRVSRATARESLGVSSDERIAIIVARLFPEKNHVLLLRAFRQVVSEVPLARLLIVGDGIEEQSIRATVDTLGLGAQVSLLGVRHDVPRLLKAADVFVLPSLREGLPVAILEAMTAGLPVIASRVGDVPTAVRHEDTGLLVPPNDEQALVAALTRLMKDASYARHLGAGAERASQAFGLTTTVEAYRALYQRVLDRRPSP